MRLDFFPSGTLTLYLAKMFITRILAVLVMLVLVLQALDLLSATGDILAVEGNGQSEILTYISLRVPALIARFLPYSVLLATIITLATLNANSEVIAMKAAGLSAHQVLAPLMLAAAVASGASFLFNELIVTRTSAQLAAWRDAEFGPVPEATGQLRNVYLRAGDDILAARLASGTGAAMRLSGVTYYRFDGNGMIAQRITAPQATYADPGWQLREGDLFDVQSARRTPVAEAIVASEVTPRQVMLESVDPDAQTLGQLRETIAAMQEAGKRTAELEAAWWHKISGPLAAFLMPLLGAVAAFGLARSGQLFLRAVIGMMLGFAYFVVDNAALAMANFGGYPPLLAAWAPFFLFALIGEAVLIRTEE